MNVAINIKRNRKAGTFLAFLTKHFHQVVGVRSLALTKIIMLDVMEGGSKEVQAEEAREMVLLRISLSPRKNKHLH